MKSHMAKPAPGAKEAKDLRASLQAAIRHLDSPGAGVPERMARAEACFRLAVLPDTPLEESIELMRRAAPERVGISLGVRVYPGTRLADRVLTGNGEGLVGGTDPAEPLFFLEPALGPDVFGWLDERIGDDRRFLFFDPSRPSQNYNYNANQRLVEAIADGYRGAYWDILRRYE